MIEYDEQSTRMRVHWIREHLVSPFLVDDFTNCYAGLLSSLLLLDPSEKASLTRHLQTLPEGIEVRAITKVLADTKTLTTSLTNSISDIIDRTAHTGHIAPRARVEETQMKILDEAIEGFVEVKFKYYTQKARKSVQRQVRPIELLFGRFAYLVASTGIRAPISYRLDLQENLKLTVVFFVPKVDWNFKEWASQSFGVFHGDAHWYIKIRFSKEVAKRAEKVQFHPTQKISHGRGGTLVLEIKCRGHRELIHELLHPDWLGHVKIESPDRLKEEFLEYVEMVKSAV